MSERLLELALWPVWAACVLACSPYLYATREGWL
jgi:hypothetical protein